MNADDVSRYVVQGSVPGGPSSWGTYAEVSTLDAAVRMAESDGARLVRPCRVVAVMNNGERRVVWTAEDGLVEE